MPGLGDNLRRWRDAAQLDWFSQFIKAWIPFNAWLTDTYGDLPDRQLLDRVKEGNNVVFNGCIPSLTYRSSDKEWQDTSPQAREFRYHIGELHRELQSCVVEGRRGRVSFETVDLGANAQNREERKRRNRTLIVERNVGGEVTLHLEGTQRQPAVAIVLSAHDPALLEADPQFQSLNADYVAQFRDMFAVVRPRLVGSVLAPHDADGLPMYGDARFIADQERVFAAVVDVIYGLRNALFHGSITPNEMHNQIYEPAFHIVMRWVKCTL